MRRRCVPRRSRFLRPGGDFAVVADRDVVIGEIAEFLTGVPAVARLQPRRLSSGSAGVSRALGLAGSHRPRV